VPVACCFRRVDSSLLVALLANRGQADLKDILHRLESVGGIKRRVLLFRPDRGPLQHRSHRIRVETSAMRDALPAPSPHGRADDEHDASASICCRRGR